jgi:hypothetical protein
LRFYRVVVLSEGLLLRRCIPLELLHRPQVPDVIGVEITSGITNVDRASWEAREAL